MREREICSTEDLHRALRDQWHGHFLYRGEDLPTYKLQPKFGRFEDTRNNVALEREMLNDFKRRGTAFIQHVPENDWEWLALGQHYGLATRLLDWTENPLIAAYFATTKPSEKSNRIIYLLDTARFVDANTNSSPFEIDDVVLYKPKHISGRISSQSGVFTVHNKPSQPFDDDRLEKWVIKDSCVVDLHLTLLSYGINEAFIFADLNGLANYINYVNIWGLVL